MRRIGWMIAGCLLLGGGMSLAAPFAVDTVRVREIIGVAGTYNAGEGVYKVSFPRTDVKVKVDGWEMPPFMGLTSWVAFQNGMPGETMAMGDLVLFQDEVNPVMSTALENGLSVTALHNHFFYDEPKVYFMHIEGQGAAETLAQAVRKTLDRSKDIRRSAPQPAASFGGDEIPSPSSIDGAAIEKILGYKGTSQNGMFKVVIGRTATMMGGATAGKEMGVNTWAGFAGSNDHALVDGDFCMHESELQKVLRALRAADINIVAIHQHMTGEEPRYLFLHYWGKGKATALAEGLKKALAETSS